MDGQKVKVKVASLFSCWRIFCGGQMDGQSRPFGRQHETMQESNLAMSAKHGLQKMIEKDIKLIKSFKIAISEFNSV